MKLFKKKTAPDPEPEVIDTLPEKLYRCGVYTQIFMDDGTVIDYDDTIKSIAEPSRAWMVPPEKVRPEFRARRIYQYKTTEALAQLVPEPTNEYDPNAIRVEVDGKMIGYVYESDHDVVWPMLLYGCACLVKIYGGPHRIVCSDGETFIAPDSRMRVELTILRND